MSEKSRVLVVTGAGRGIGLELCRQALEAGHTVIAGVRRPEAASELQTLSREPRIRVLPLDIRSEDSVASFAKAIETDRVDVLINNAGIYQDRDASSAKVPAAIVLETIDTNAVGPVRVTQALLPLLRKSAAPVVANISSQMGSIADNGSGSSAAYRMSKAALNMFSKTLAVDERGLTVLALHPGWVKTSMGGAGAPVEPHDSARALLKLILEAKREDSGRFINYTGAELPW